MHVAYVMQLNYDVLSVLALLGIEGERLMVVARNLSGNEF